MGRVKDSIKTKFDDVLDYHPRQVIGPTNPMIVQGSSGTNQPWLHINTAVI